MSTRLEPFDRHFLVLEDESPNCPGHWNASVNECALDCATSRGLVCLRMHSYRYSETRCWAHVAHISVHPGSDRPEVFCLSNNLRVYGYMQASMLVQNLNASKISTNSVKLMQRPGKSMGCHGIFTCRKSLLGFYYVGLSHYFFDEIGMTQAYRITMCCIGLPTVMFPLISFVQAEVETGAFAHSIDVGMSCQTLEWHPKRPILAGVGSPRTSRDTGLRIWSFQY